MTRLVLVEFDDPAEAKRFVEKVNGSYEAVSMPRRRVIGVWARASKFCECTTLDNKRKAFTRGQKTGWWLHDSCGRPTREWALSNAWSDSLGRNLLSDNPGPTGTGFSAEPYPNTIFPGVLDPNRRSSRKRRARSINPRRAGGEVLPGDDRS